MSPWSPEAARLGLPQLLGPACRERDLAYALIVSRVVRPRPKSATRSWWEDVTLGPDLGWPTPGGTRCSAMNWLLTRQDVIEAELARRHLRGNGQRAKDRRERSRGPGDVRLGLVVGGGQLLPAAGRGYFPGALRRQVIRRSSPAWLGRRGRSPS